MNSDSLIRTPYNTLPITLAMRSVNRKVWRDQYCIECGHPFIAISDKFFTVIDAAIPMKIMRGDEMLIEARCRNHTCKQRYNLYI